MEREQLVIQRAREFFDGRLDEVLQIVRQDREELRGWQEPAPLRAALRRSVQEGQANDNGPVSAAVMETELGRAAGEPGKGEQREALGELLEAGAAALKKLLASLTPEMSSDELFGLECVLLLYGRPGLLVSRGRLAPTPAFWRVLDAQRADVELAQRGVGRIELVGHPDFDWAGTGFLVGETCLMTTRSVAQVFSERTNRDDWQFRPGISAWMDYQPEYQHPPSATYRLRSVLGVHEEYDLAVLEVEPPQQQHGPLSPLALASEAPTNLNGRPVYLIGYPVRDGRRNEPERIARVFRDDYNVKRIQPGVLRGVETFGGLHLLRHDCAQLGRMAGSCIVDLETHRILGLQVSGRYLENGTAVPLWMLRDDPLLAKCNVNFAKATSEDLAAVTSQIERLSRTRHWPELRATVTKMYEQAFGKGTAEK